MSRILLLASALCLTQGAGTARAAESLWAAADFDGDHKVDFARVTLAPRFSGAALEPGGGDAVARLLAGQPMRGLILRSQDVDADQDQDLILKDAAGGKALGVWLNDGHGAFSIANPRGYPAASGFAPPIRTQAPLARPNPAFALAPDSILKPPARHSSLEQAPGLNSAAALDRVQSRERTPNSNRGPPAVLR